MGDKGGGGGGWDGCLDHTGELTYTNYHQTIKVALNQTDLDKIY